MSLKKTLKKAGKSVKKLAKKATKILPKAVPLVAGVASGGIAGIVGPAILSGINKAGKYKAPMQAKLDQQADNAGMAPAFSAPGYTPTPYQQYDQPIGPQPDGSTGGASFFEKNKAIILGGAAVALVLFLVAGRKR